MEAWRKRARKAVTLEGKDQMSSLQENGLLEEGMSASTKSRQEARRRPEGGPHCRELQWWRGLLWELCPRRGQGQGLWAGVPRVPGNWHQDQDGDTERPGYQEEPRHMGLRQGNGCLGTHPSERKEGTLHPTWSQRSCYRHGGILGRTGDNHDQCDHRRKECYQGQLPYDQNTPSEDGLQLAWKDKTLPEDHGPVQEVKYLD